MFPKGYSANWSEDVFVVIEIKNTVPWTYEKELQKTSQEKSRIEKVLKRKGDKLNVKWEEDDNR